MPSFSIEAVSEAVPLSSQALQDILTRAASSNQQQVQTATQQLQNWERQSGFYSGLQTLFTDGSLPLEVRHLAIISLKNGVDKYWRKTAQNAISKQEKEHIRSRCVQAGLQEPNARLGLQNAVIVAKITRHEFPHDWPDAIESMTQTLRAADTVVLPRILLIILYVVKELSTAKLQRSRVSLYNAAPDLFRALCDAYVQLVRVWTSFVEHGGDDEGGAIAAVEHSLLALRVLRRLIIAGYQRPADASEVQELWKVVQSHFGQFYQLSHNLQSNTRSLVEKHLVQISKLHLNMIREHPTAFPQLPGAIGIAQSYWGLLLEFGKTFGIQALTPVEIGTDGDADEEPSYMEKLSLKALLLLRACVKMVYSPTQTFRYVKADEKEERKQSRETMKQALLSETLVREMMETLVVKFFVFRPRDLREWETEPDEWERTQEGEGESWEHSVRTCAEKLFLDLVLNNKDLLVPPLLHVFSAASM
jgi:Importin-beta N-terminal domain